MIKLYEVYLVAVFSIPVYIGSGRSSLRHHHVTSGKSHNESLNRLNRECPEAVSVTVIKDNLTQERSLQLEQELIDYYKPPYNKTGNYSYYKEWIPIEELKNKGKK